MEKVSVKICQRDYSLKTDESPEKIKKLAEQLEQTILYVSRKARGMNETEITTLASMILISDIENVLKKDIATAEELQEEINRLKNNETLHLAEIEELKRELEEQRAVAADDTAQKEKLLSEKAELTSELEQAKQSETAKEQEIAGLKRELEEQRALAADDTAQKENEKLLSEKAELTSELEQIKQSETAKEQEIARLKQELEEQRALAADDTAQKENEKLSAEKAELTAELERLKQEAQADRVQFEQLSSAKNEEAERLRLRVAEYEKQIQNADSEHEKEFEALFEEHEKECKIISEKRDKEIAGIKEEYEKKMSELEAKLKEQEEKNVTMKATLSNYESTFDMYVKNKEKELRQAHEETEAVKAKNSDLEKQLAKSGDVQMTIC